MVIREDGHGRVVAQGLQEKKVTNVEEMLAAVKLGNRCDPVPCYLSQSVVVSCVGLGGVATDPVCGVWSCVGTVA